MKPHKWAKEIKAWADGAEIEARNREGYNNPIAEFAHWWTIKDPRWETHDDIEYRIKPQPKKSRYLFVYNKGSLNVPNLICVDNPLINMDEKTHQFVGKIKLEAEDEI